MTDTGRFPDEGQPENAGALPGHPLSADGAAPADTGDPSAYSYLDHDVADEDDLLLMPGAQGAWSEQPAAPGGTHETGGRDTGSLDYTSVRAPAQAAAPAPPRRPLHLGPPVPEPNSGVVRSLADRGPAAPQQPVGSPVRPPAPPVGGVEYLDVPPADGVPHAEVPPVDAAPVEVPPVDVPPVAFVPPQHTADAVLAAHDIAAAGGPATAPDDGSAAASGVPGPRVPEPAPVMTVAPGAAQALVDRVAPTPPAGTPLGGIAPSDGAGVAAEAPAEAASAEAVPVDAVAGAPSAEPTAEDVAPEQAPAPVDVPSVVDVPVDAAVPGDVPSAEAGTAPEPIPAGTQVGESVEEAAAAVADGAQSAEAAEPVAGGAPADVPSAAVPPQETAPAAPVEAVPGPAQQVTAPTVAEPAVPAPAQGVPAGVRGMGVMAFLDAPVPLAAVDAMPAPEAVTASPAVVVADAQTAVDQTAVDGTVAGGGQSVPAPVEAVQAAVAPVVEGAAAQASAVTAIEDAVPQAAVAIDGGVPVAGQAADVSLTDGTAPPAASAAGAGQPVPAQSDAAADNASLPTADASATEGAAPQAAVPAVATEGSAADGGQSDTGVDGDAPATGDAASPAASAAGGEQPDAAVVTDIAGAPQVPAATAAPATGGEQSDAAAPQAAPEGTAPAQTGTVVADAPHAAGGEVETGVAVAVAAPAPSVSGAPQTADAAAPEAAAPVAEDEQPGADVAAPAQAATTVAAVPQAAPVAEGEQPAPDVAASEQAVAADAAAPPQTASEVAAPAQTQTVEAAAVAAVPQAAAPVAEDEQPMPDVAAPAQAGTPVADVPQSAEAATDAAAPQAGAPVVEDEPAAADVATPAQAGTAVAGAPQSAEVVAEAVAAAPQAAPATEGEQAAPDVAALAQSVPGAPQTADAAAPQAAAPAPVAEDEPVADVAVPAQAGTAVVGTPQSADAEAEAETGAAVDAAAPQAAAAPAANGEQPAPDDAPAVPATAGEPTDGTPQPPAGDPADGYAAAERAAVHRVMRERRDIRKGFRRDPVPPEVLLRVLEAAHTAPSVGHSQPWDFVVIRSAETRKTMHDLVARQREAYAKSLPKARAKQFKELKIEAILDTPVNIVVTADPTRGGRHTLGRHTQPQMAPYSSALAVENLWLAARAEGLGVGWVSFFDEREMVRALGLPEHLEVVAYLCVGYVDEFPDEPELMQAGWSKRRPLSWVVHEEEYGRRALPGEDPHDLLAETLRGIRPLDAKALGEAWERQKRMTKPSGALGMLEIISAQLCGLSRKCPPPIPEPAAVAIFAGDHGVHNQGVTAWPQEVTSQMVANFLGGGAVCNAFANQVGAEVCVVDVGVAGELPSTPGLLPRKIRPGTNDFTTGPAMTREEAMRALEVGIETARDLVTAGNKALLTGEMGIANTTVSAALIAVYTGADPAEITGRGTGINDEMHARKVDVVRRALELHQPDPKDPIGVLAAIGGLEHAAMVGLILGGASLRTPVILDGVSAGAAALVARAIAPEALAACIAGHRSAEPGHVAALTKLGLRPLVDLDLRLGEGTGALLALPVVQSAARAMHEVATFDTAGVSEKG